MSKIDFNRLVSSTLFEQDINTGPGNTSLQSDTANTIVTAINNKFPTMPIGPDDLERIYRFYQSRYFTGEQILSLNLFDILPIVDVVAKSHNGSDKAKGAAKNSDINTFYQPLKNGITGLTGNLKPLQNGYMFQDSEMNRLYRVALKEKNNNVLAENVWPSISNLSIINALLSILDTRLTKMEKTKISINMLTSVFKSSVLSRTSFLRYCETLIKDVFNYLPEFSSGAKKANKDIVDVLQNINVGYDDLLQLATYTNSFYEELLKNKFSNAQEENNVPNYEQRAINASLQHVKENALLLAEYGTFKFTLPTTKEVTNISVPVSPEYAQTAQGQEIKQKQPIYTLQEIERTNTASGKEIIKILKNISTGIRTKQSPWKTIGQAVDKITSLGVGMGPVG